MPVISIVVPIYNQDRYLAQCVDSLLCQSFSDVEIILVDDGSTDQSGAMCDRYGGRDSRIRVIHKGNGGLSDARNAGIDAASGEYIGFVDSDDFVAKDLYEKLITSLKKEDADIAVCSCTIVDEEGRFMPRENEKCVLSDCTYTGGQILNGQGAYWLNVVAWNKLYKRTVFAELRYPKGKYHEDEFVFHKIYAQAKKVVTISDKLYFYRRTQGSITDPKNVFFTLDRAEAMYGRINFCIQKGYVNNILNYEKTMFMPLDIMVRRGKIGPEHKAGYHRVKQLNREIVKTLRAGGYISLKMYLGRYAFYMFPFLWRLDQILCRIYNKLSRISRPAKADRE